MRGRSGHTESFGSAVMLEVGDAADSALIPQGVRAGIR
jgi:hypothetical protein